jgi:hypothetical protein
MQLTILDHLPDGLLGSDITRLAGLLKGPTLIHLPGRDPRPLFVSVLLHGNEPTGFETMQAVLRRNAGGVLPRAMSLFIGNVAAAARGVRTLPGQSDYNRVWPGTTMPDRPEAALMRQVVEQVRALKPFASIDIHNTSGMNPHYACVSRLEQPCFHLARLFSRIVIYIERPFGIQSRAMADLCPAVTVECGRIGDDYARDRALEFVEACLRLSHFPDHDISPHDIELLQTVAVLKVPADVSFSFDDSPADIRFRADIDHLNFSQVEAGTMVGWIDAPGRARVEVLPGGDFEVLEEFLEHADGELRFSRNAVPAMLTRDPNAVRLDCLGYLMERIGFDGRPIPPAGPGGGENAIA